MRIVLSRKGFDSSAGGVASPILPSGTLCSLPIPEPGDDDARGRPYGTIEVGGTPLGPVVADLTGERLGSASVAHLDPDLDAGSVPRRAGWKSTFGQAGAAESHLQNQGVGPGDIFLFFGWFREVEKVSGQFRYVADSPDRHVLLGWLQVERRIPAVERKTLPAWALDHPHAVAPYSKKDSLYVAREELTLERRPLGVAGGGFFREYDPALCLTAPGQSRSLWALPAWIHPEGRESCLSYHRRPERWSHMNGQTLLHTVGRGQEFVLDCGDYPEAVSWARDLIVAFGR